MPCNSCSRLEDAKQPMLVTVSVLAASTAQDNFSTLSRGGGLIRDDFMTPSLTAANNLAMHRLVKQRTA